MPYLAFDLDAKKLVPQVAKSAGVQTSEIGWGLLELWDFVWSKKTATVDTLVLTGCFGPNERITEALVSYGFLEPEEHGYRVKGAERYLRVSEARSLGGKKAAGNLKRGNKAGAAPAGAEPGKSPGSLPAPAGDQPGASRGGFPALTASSEQRAANDLFPADAGKPQKPKREQPTDPRHRPLVKALCDAAPGYAQGFDGRDAKAVTSLLAKGDEAEILRRWKFARGRDDFPRVRSLPELVTHWHHFAADAPAANKPTHPPKQECEVIAV